MKIGFFGTPLLASFCLEKLHQDNDIEFVVTSVDKPAGRNRKPLASPVKKLAIDQGIPVLQPVDINNKETVEQIKSFKAQVYVVVAYGKIIPEEIFSYPAYKAINLHPSLLPKYRGAAPIEWTIINGEKETGVTIQLINERLDAGDIIMQKTIPLDNNMTSEDLYKIVLPLGAGLITETLELFKEGSAIPCANIQTLVILT